jgi:hypothetical protein
MAILLPPLSIPCSMAQYERGGIIKVESEVVKYRKESSIALEIRVIPVFR